MLNAQETCKVWSPKKDWIAAQEDSGSNVGGHTMETSESIILKEEIRRIKQAMEKPSKYYYHDLPKYMPTRKQIEAAKLKIRKDKGEVFLDLD